jgi:hypothetical protein
MDSISKMNERTLLPAVHKILSEPGSVWVTVSGKRVQILSSGKMNVHEGPDFLDMALIIDGDLRIGDGEFHKKVNFWKSHKHGEDERYSKVILHIAPEPQHIVDNNIFETLLIDYAKIIEGNKSSSFNTKLDLNSLIDLQKYALDRLNRKTNEIREVFLKIGIEEALRFILNSFLFSFVFRRRRPVYDSNSLGEIYEDILISKHIEVIKDIYNNRKNSDCSSIATLLNEKIAGEGSHLRQEIFVNCFLPLVLCIAKNKLKTELMVMFWSLQAHHKYGILKRRFANLPQNYVWQQQGMLEYLKEFDRI